MKTKVPVSCWPYAVQWVNADERMPKDDDDRAPYLISRGPWVEAVYWDNERREFFVRDWFDSERRGYLGYDIEAWYKVNLPGEELPEGQKGLEWHSAEHRSLSDMVIHYGRKKGADEMICVCTYSDEPVVEPKEGWWAELPSGYGWTGEMGEVLDRWYEDDYDNSWFEWSLYKPDQIDGRRIDEEKRTYLVWFNCEGHDRFAACRYKDGRLTTIDGEDLTERKDLVVLRYQFIDLDNHRRLTSGL